MGPRRWPGGKGTCRKGTTGHGTVSICNLDTLAVGGWKLGGGRHSLYRLVAAQVLCEHSQKGDKLSQTIDVKRLIPDGRLLTSPCTVWQCVIHRHDCVGIQCTEGRGSLADSDYNLVSKAMEIIAI